MRLTSEKQQALLHGDTSGNAIHPYFIHSTQSMGMYLYEDIDNFPTMVLRQARYLQTSFELMVEIFKGYDWELRTQVSLWNAAGSIIVSFGESTFMYMQRICEDVNAAGLRFIPAYGRPPVFSEALHERMSVLSQVIYFENFLFLTAGGAEPTRTARIEKEFRYQLPEAYPVLFKICPLTMRTKAILLVRDTVVMLLNRPTDGAQLCDWRQSCDGLVAILCEYSETLLWNLRRFEELGDKNGAGVIRDSCMICFAHLAVLCNALGGIGSTPPTELDVLCDSSLGRLGELAQGTREDQYTNLDLVLGESWRKTLGVFDDRIAKVPSERAADLRNRKQAVTKAHLEFSVKLPDFRVPTLAWLVGWVDGRTEGSQYPNLIPPIARREYGI